MDESARHRYYVSPEGCDTSSGTLDAPFRTIQRAVDVMGPGDRCLLRAGTYHEAVRIQDLHGAEGSPIVFSPYKDETVTLDGTVPIPGPWEQHSKNIFKTVLEHDIWQLFDHGEMMTAARWPNAALADGSLWDQDATWGWQHGKSRYGHLFDDGKQDLAGTGIDFTGAIAIMNIGSFRTYARFVENHKAGSDNFTYSRDLWERLGTKRWENYVEKGRYYLEGKLECLDSPGEWFFAPKSKTLYVWPRDRQDKTGKTIDNTQLSGKTQTYALDVQDSSHIVFQRFNFFATTLRFQKCRGMVVRDCDFMYPSYSKRMLRILEDPDVTTIVSPIDTPSRNSLVNCSFAYADGSGLVLEGLGDRVENCLFHDLDYSCLGPGFTINAGRSVETVLRRNTIHTAGDSETIQGGTRCLVELNHIYNCGLMQDDGSTVQIGVRAVTGSRVCYNWTHDTDKKCLRFDAPIPPVRFGAGGRIDHNVVWGSKIEGIMVKGTDHAVCSNLGFDNGSNDIVVLDDSDLDGGGNARSVTRNNIGNRISGHRVDAVPVPAEYDHNWNGIETGRDVRTQLRDPDNLDFRPRKNSELIKAGKATPDAMQDPNMGPTDIGPYEFDAENYWIPGRREIRASTPVPPDNATNVKRNANLMWLPALNAKENRLFFGTEPDELTFRKVQTNNIFHPDKSKLPADTVFYWRVDTVTADGTKIPGQVWSFRTGNV